MEWDFKTVALTILIMLSLFLVQRSATTVAAKATEKISSTITNNQHKLLPYTNPIKRDLRHLESKLP
jgi:archaellin